MEHLEPELLAQYALEDVTPGAGEQQHLAGCAVCRAEIEELRELAGLARELESGDGLEAPPPLVWDRVVEELGLNEGARTTAPYAGTTLADRDPVRIGDTRAAGRAVRHGRSRVVLVGAVAAAAGLIAGVLGARVLGEDNPVPTQPPPVASVRLDPLTGKTGDGVANLISTGTGTELRVGVNGLPAPQGFYELWLINVDGKRMVSLGVLDPSAGGTYVVPPKLTAQGYRIVDVSLEPEDGKPEHSLDSVIRGTLPA
ncbi:anti-sigma factor [Kribbella sp. CA-293567]|uniref:anti-sigma factor n=1 Tax=Kribbella sp. CA-293567 TaxID=3002436 RepID=UPI0022DD7840|nr:anti-sigma factor [Kribbella sp. CA-293567]WBQ04031.1 anti-sigma factor [Kribbella sp. CA-293567]